MVIIIAATPNEAHADGVSIRAKQLRSHSSYKVRLNAALWLGKQSDGRAVSAMAYALGHDDVATVRTVAAVALGNMIDESTPASARDDGIDALARARTKDSSAKVRAKAEASYRKVKALRRPKRGKLPKVFVAVGTPTAKGRTTPQQTADVQAAMRRALRQSAPELGQGTSKDGLPTRAQLARARTKGFFINASVRSVDVVKRRGGVEVRCSVTMRVSPWTGRDGAERLRENESASATGNGRVRGASSARAIENARRDCVTAVVEEVTARQIVPFVRRAADVRVAQKRQR